MAGWWCTLQLLVLCSVHCVIGFQTADAVVTAEEVDTARPAQVQKDPASAFAVEGAVCASWMVFDTFAPMAALVAVAVSMMFVAWTHFFFQRKQRSKSGCCDIDKAHVPELPSMRVVVKDSGSMGDVDGEGLRSVGIQTDESDALRSAKLRLVAKKLEVDSLRRRLQDDRAKRHKLKQDFDAASGRLAGAREQVAALAHSRVFQERQIGLQSGRLEQTHKASRSLDTTARVCSRLKPRMRIPLLSFPPSPESGRRTPEFCCSEE